MALLWLYDDEPWRVLIANWPNLLFFRRIYIYGEAWNFGEVVDNQRGINCSQLNLTGRCLCLPG